MRNWFSRRAGTSHTTGHSSAIQVPDRSRGMDALHVFVLTSFAIAQPVYDRLAVRTAFLVDLQLGYPALYALVAALTLALPVAIVLLEWLVWYCRRSAYDACHLCIVFLLSVLLILPALKLAVFLPGLAVCCIALIAAVAVSWCYCRFRQVRSVTTLAAPGILIFPVVFLFHGTSNLTASLPRSSRTNDWQPVPVVMLVFDEFTGYSLMTPEREIDAVRFPNIAELARQSTWYRNATSVSHFTEFAVPAILSGRYPFTKSFPSVGDLPQNVFSVLAHTGGYDLAAFEPVSRLARDPGNALPKQALGTWKQVGFLADTLGRVFLFHLTPADFARYLPVIPVAWFGVNEASTIDTAQRRGVFRYEWGNQRNSQFQHFLACIDGSAKPTLHFLHLLSPHVPWCYLPSGRRYAEDGENWELLDLTTHGSNGDEWGQDELEVVQSQQRYLLQLMYLDGLIGQLISRLKETGQYDRCLLILTADHGISFRNNAPRRAIVPHNQDEILSIPLFIKRPGQVTGAVSDRIVESVDILPTIADVLGIALHGTCDGRSVFDDSQPARTRPSFSDFGRLSTIDPAVIVNSHAPQTWRKRLGDSSDSESLFRIGPLPQLIGTVVADFKQLSAPALELDLIRYGDVVDDRAPVQVPCLYEGTIRSHIPLSESPVILAVVINGTIRAVTRTYTQAGFLNQWAVLVPESVFHAGKNEVQFYRVTGTDPDWRLTPCIAHQRVPRP